MPSPAGHRGEMVRVEGLAQLRRALRKMDRTLDRGLTTTFRATGKLIVGRARRFAPEGPADDPNRGQLRKSIKQSVTSRRASIYSNDPKANVHEWGGTIRPRGVPIKVPRRAYMRRAVAESRREIDAMLDHLLDSIADAWDD